MPTPTDALTVRVRGFARQRYCALGSTSLTWHADMRPNHVMYRCTCMRLFRLPDGTTGPNGCGKRSKTFDKKYRMRANLRRIGSHNRGTFKSVDELFNALRID